LAVGPGAARDAALDDPHRHEHGGHGRSFTDACNRIGALLGLAPVKARRRKNDPRNLPISSDWPFGVRPGGEHGGFYGDLWERVGAKEETFDGFAFLCAAWANERVTPEDRVRFLLFVREQVVAAAKLRLVMIDGDGRPPSSTDRRETRVADPT
jgi:hypothetical protein